MSAPLQALVDAANSYRVAATSLSRTLDALDPAGATSPKPFDALCEWDLYALVSTNRGRAGEARAAIELLARSIDDVARVRSAEGALRAALDGASATGSSSGMDLMPKIGVDDPGTYARTVVGVKPPGAWSASKTWTRAVAPEASTAELLSTVSRHVTDQLDGTKAHGPAPYVRYAADRQEWVDSMQSWYDRPRSISGRPNSATWSEPGGRRTVRPVVLPTMAAAYRTQAAAMGTLIDRIGLAPSALDELVAGSVLTDTSTRSASRAHWDRGVNPAADELALVVRRAHLPAARRSDDALQLAEGRMADASRHARTAVRGDVEAARAAYVETFLNS